MNRKRFCFFGIAPLIAMRLPVIGAEHSKEELESGLKIHLDIWEFESRLNRRIPNKSFIEINPHTTRFLSENIHFDLRKARECLEKDITLLLVIKKNKSIAKRAKLAGISVDEDYFHKEEWRTWIDFLKRIEIENTGTNKNLPEE